MQGNTCEYRRRLLNKDASGGGSGDGGNEGRSIGREWKLSWTLALCLFSLYIMCSFQIVSLLVIPQIHLCILITFTGQQAARRRDRRGRRGSSTGDRAVGV